MFCYYQSNKIEVGHLTSYWSRYIHCFIRHLIGSSEFAPLRLCETYTALVEQLSLLFVTITKTLTTQQLN